MDFVVKKNWKWFGQSTDWKYIALAHALIAKLFAY